MGFLFKKKEVPGELPDLAFEEISKKLNVSLPIENKPEEKKNDQFSKQIFNEEQGYFKNLIKEISQETTDLDKLDSWYKDSFLPSDNVLQMRKYWEKQKPDILSQRFNKDLNNKLLEKTEKLHSLEKEWQKTYFNLLSKEEEIKKEEKELKESLSHFLEFQRQSVKKEKKTKKNSYRAN